jgi:hypothetical protein
MKRDLLEKHLESVEGMQEAQTDTFFYTRLKARMDKTESWSLPLRPVFTIPVLLILLLVNGFMLSKQSKPKEIESNTSSIQQFASSYDQTVANYY